MINKQGMEIFGVTILSIKSRIIAMILIVAVPAGPTFGQSCVAGSPNVVVSGMTVTRTFPPIIIPSPISISLLITGVTCATTISNQANCTVAASIGGAPVLQAMRIGTPSASCVWSNCDCTVMVPVIGTQQMIAATAPFSITTADGLPVELMEFSIDAKDMATEDVNSEK